MKILDSFSLKGKVALVTGGAGKYGTQITRAMVQAGATTYIASRKMDQLKRLCDEINGEGNDGRVIPAVYDQGDEGSILKLKDLIVKNEKKVDILVNNAVARTMSGWNDDLAKFEASMHINATGLFAITRAFGDVMAEAGSGSIINIGSIQGMVGPDGTLYEDLDFHGFVPDYFFHKGGMINFTRFTANYYGPKNVRCNCLSPGGFFANQPDLFVERYSNRTALGRMASDTDLMGAVVFLACDASKYITGVNIAVDGGYTAK